MSVTQDAIRTLVTHPPGEPINKNFQPICQVLDVKQVPNAGGQDRYRIILSDGTYFVSGMLTSQLCYLAQNGQLTTNVLIQIEDYMVNKVHDRTLIILLKMEILNNGQPLHGRIGTPTDIEKSGIVAAAAAAAAGQQGAAAGGGGGAAPLYNSTNGYTGMTNGGAPKPPAGVGSSNSHMMETSPPMARPTSNPYGQRPASSGAAVAPIVRSDGGMPGHHAGVGGGGGSGSGMYTPISALNMYNNKWTLRARLVNKSDIRTWSNAKGEGSLFSVELLDASKMDIRATFFKEAVDKFYNFVQVGQVYTWTGGRLKVANMQWNTCKSEYEITFDANAEIHQADDGADIDKNQQYNLQHKIADLESVEPGGKVDLLAVVKEVGIPAALVSKKTGKDVYKCDLVLVDETLTEITLTVWGQEQSNSAPTVYADHPVVAVRQARVSDFGGKSLSGASAIDVSPDIPQAQELVRRRYQTRVHPNPILLCVFLRLCEK